MADTISPSLSDVFAAYGHASIAKVQMRKFKGWGGVIGMPFSTV